MKKILLGLAFIASAIFITSPALAVPATPAECSSVSFDKVIEVTRWGEKVYGTSGNDLIFVNGGSKIYGLGGDDCIVASDGGNKVDGGTGYDRAVLSGWGDKCLSIEEGC